LQGVFFWDLVTYLIEGLVFIFTGLQAQAIVERIRDGSFAQFSFSAALVVLVVIVARFLWIYPMTYAPRWLSPALAKRDPAPPWQYPFVVAFTGVRGIVSLAAALAVPLTTASGALFPYRDEIFFLAFTVVMATLVCQGAMLPWIIKWLGLARAGLEERQADRAEEFHARRNAIEAARTKLATLTQERDIPEEALASLCGQLDYFATRVRMKCDVDEERRALIELHDELDLALIETERDFVNELLRKGELKDETRRRMERELDLREADVLNRRNQRAG
jgi:CPA1 family monovalent cation:H+ antiporter